MSAAPFAHGFPSSDAVIRVRRMPAWLLSVGLHTIAIVTLALLLHPVAKGPAVEPARTAGIALVQRSANETTYFTESDADQLSQEQLAALPTDASAQPTALAELPVDPAITLPSTNDVGGSLGLGEVLPGAIGFTTGSQPAKRTSGGQAQTQVFGAQGTGTKFIYVFDRSASMSGFQGRPMIAARQQLLASLDDLESIHQFQIVFYNDTPAVFNPDRPRPPHILFATEENKRLAKSFIESISPAGGTRHLDALKLALGMNPDVVFFLTDAAEPQLSPRELAEIRRRNRAEATIHSIEFGSGPFPGGDNFLVRLARQNHGKHVYVDVTKLP